MLSRDCWSGGNGEAVEEVEGVPAAETTALKTTTAYQTSIHQTRG